MFLLLLLHSFRLALYCFFDLFAPFVLGCKVGGACCFSVVVNDVSLRSPKHVTAIHGDAESLSYGRSGQIDELWICDLRSAFNWGSQKKK